MLSPWSTITVFTAIAAHMASVMVLFAARTVTIALALMTAVLVAFVVVVAATFVAIVFTVTVIPVAIMVTVEATVLIAIAVAVAVAVTPSPSGRPPATRAWFTQQVVQSALRVGERVARLLERGLRPAQVRLQRRHLMFAFAQFVAEFISTRLRVVPPLLIHREEPRALGHFTERTDERICSDSSVFVRGELRRNLPPQLHARERRVTERQVLRELLRVVRLRGAR